ncbi:hypothetical protein ACHAXT_002808 [Thalassiosira profunda]
MDDGHHMHKTRCFHSTPSFYAQKNRGKKGKQSQQSGKSKKKKKQSSNAQKKAKQPRRGKDIIEQMQKAQQKEVPQAFLASTASTYAYISRCAVIDEQSGEVHVDPKTLFAEVASARQEGPDGKKRSQPTLPRVFRKSHFQYFPPSAFPDMEPPRNGPPEVAFLGRSNTGKSSLINALSSLIHRSGGGPGRPAGSGGGELARTSKRPGRTQTINYFGLVSNDDYAVVAPSSNWTKKQQIATQAKLYLVDLPGFGYAAAPDQSVDEWQKKTQKFLISRATFGDEEGDKHAAFGSRRTRPPLKRLYLLVDSRLPDPPLLDLTVMGWCDEYAIPYTVVLTKVDGSSRANCVKLTNQLCMRYHSLLLNPGDEDDEGEDAGEGEVYMDPVVYWTSSKDRLGMEELLLSVESNLFSAEEDHEVEGDVEEEEEEFDYDTEKDSLYEEFGIPRAEKIAEYEDEDGEMAR